MTAGCVDGLRGSDTDESSADDNSPRPSGQTPEANSAGPRWESGPSLPEQRTELTAASLDGRLYVVGGVLPETAGRDVVAADSVYVYGPETGVWETTASMPEAVHHVAIAAPTDNIVVVGGHAGWFEPVDSVWRFDGDTWASLTSLPTPRGALTASVIDGRIYAVGGTTSEKPVATLTMYDPDTDSWTRREPMPTSREHLASAVVAGRLHVIGGRDETGNQDTHEVYDPERDSWTTAAPIPTPRSGHEVTELDGRLYALGGESASRTFDETEVYDPETNGWSSLDPMPTGRHGLGACRLAGDIFTVAGGPRPGFTYSNVLEVLRFDG